MHLPYRDISGLIFSDQVGFFSVCYLCSAADDNPVFRAMMMHLHGKLGARLHCDSLDLITVTAVYGVINAPGAIHLTVVHMLVPAIIANLLDHCFYFLNLVFASNKNRVFGFDDNEIIDTNRCDEPTVCTHKGVAGLESYHVTAQAIAISVFIANFPKSGPGTYIAPPSVERNNRSVIGFFHNGVVDGFGGAAGEQLRVYPYKVEVFIGVCHGCAAGFENIRAVQLKLVQVLPVTKHKHAAVPEVFSRFKIGFCRLTVWLFHKAINGVAIGRNLVAAVYVSVTGFRLMGNNSKGHKLAFFG